MLPQSTSLASAPSLPTVQPTWEMMAALMAPGSSWQQQQQQHPTAGILGAPEPLHLPTDGIPLTKVGGGAASLWADNSATASSTLELLLQQQQQQQQQESALMNVLGGGGSSWNHLRQSGVGLEDAAKPPAAADASWQLLQQMLGTQGPTVRPTADLLGSWASAPGQQQQQQQHTGVPDPNILRMLLESMG